MLTETSGAEAGTKASVTKKKYVPWEEQRSQCLAILQREPLTPTELKEAFTLHGTVGLKMFQNKIKSGRAIYGHAFGALDYVDRITDDYIRRHGRVVIKYSDRYRAQSVLDNLVELGFIGEDGFEHKSLLSRYPWLKADDHLGIAILLYFAVAPFDLETDAQNRLMRFILEESFPDVYEKYQDIVKDPNSSEVTAKLNGMITSYKSPKSTWAAVQSYNEGVLQKKADDARSEDKDTIQPSKTFSQAFYASELSYHLDGIETEDVGWAGRREESEGASFYMDDSETTAKKTSAKDVDVDSHLLTLSCDSSLKNLLKEHLGLPVGDSKRELQAQLLSLVNPENGGFGWTDNEQYSWMRESQKVIRSLLELPKEDFLDKKQEIMAVEFDRSAPFNPKYPTVHDSLLAYAIVSFDNEVDTNTVNKDPNKTTDEKRTLSLLLLDALHPTDLRFAVRHYIELLINNPEASASRDFGKVADTLEKAVESMIKYAEEQDFEARFGFDRDKLNKLQSSIIHNEVEALRSLGRSGCAPTASAGAGAGAGAEFSMPKPARPGYEISSCYIDELSSDWSKRVCDKETDPFVILAKGLFQEISSLLKLAETNSKYSISKDHLRMLGETLSPLVKKSKANDELVMDLLYLLDFLAIGQKGRHYKQKDESAMVNLFVQLIKIVNDDETSPWNKPGKSVLDDFNYLQPGASPESATMSSTGDARGAGYSSASTFHSHLSLFSEDCNAASPRRWRGETHLVTGAGSKVPVASVLSAIAEERADEHEVNP